MLTQNIVMCYSVDGNVNLVSLSEIQKIRRVKINTALDKPGILFDNNSLYVADAAQIKCY